MNDYPTTTRYCCGFAMILRRKLPNGNEEVECRHCNRREEISQTGYAIPKTPRKEKTR